jgi:hypothetical protein
MIIIKKIYVTESNQHFIITDALMTKLKELYKLEFGTDYLFKINDNCESNHSDSSNKRSHMRNVIDQTHSQQAFTSNNQSKSDNDAQRDNSDNDNVCN